MAAGQITGTRKVPRSREVWSEGPSRSKYCSDLLFSRPHGWSAAWWIGMASSYGAPAPHILESQADIRCRWSIAAASSRLVCGVMNWDSSQADIRCRWSIGGGSCSDRPSASNVSLGLEDMRRRRPIRGSHPNSSRRRPAVRSTEEEVRAIFRPARTFTSNFTRTRYFACASYLTSRHSANSLSIVMKVDTLISGGSCSWGCRRGA